ncbi:MAG: hypothetical protein IT324_24415 [Anaerolineae bacterium]|nr:hypothetical protein [Anaerolineae bacterium]
MPGWIDCSGTSAITVLHRSFIQEIKEHWNTLTCDGSIPDEETLGMIDHSYAQVVKGLPCKDRELLTR